VVPACLIGVEAGDDPARRVSDLEFLADGDPGTPVQDLARSGADFDGGKYATLADVVLERLVLLLRQFGQDIGTHVGLSR
jgi:hypothetical protein